MQLKPKNNLPEACVNGSLDDQFAILRCPLILASAITGNSSQQLAGFSLTAVLAVRIGVRFNNVQAIFRTNR